ncbi:MAG: hypothetical protein IT561_27015 [Alphaproteobacteria bacterium]|nr:hypothetical protein [Alphaproteobacteria bacterium]
MRTLKTLAAAGLICATMASAPAVAQTQAPAASSGFDAYRALAVTAGVIGGTMVAIVVTDGLIIPVIAWASGGSAGAGAGGAWAGGMGMRAVAGESMMMGGAEGGMAQGGYGLLRGGMKLLGAIGGGLYADAWYMGK